MMSGPHTSALVRAVEVEFRAVVDDIGDEPDPSATSRARAASIVSNTASPCSRHGSYSSAYSKLRGDACTDDEDRLAVALAVPEHGVDRRAQRCEPDPTGGDHEVAAVEVEVPRRAERSAHPELVARSHAGQRARDRVRRAGSCTRGIAVSVDRRADRDRRLTDPERADHADLGRQEVERFALDRHDIGSSPRPGVRRSSAMHLVHGAAPAADRSIGAASETTVLMRSPPRVGRAIRPRRSGRCRPDTR